MGIVRLILLLLCCLYCLFDCLCMLRIRFVISGKSGEMSPDLPAGRIESERDSTALVWDTVQGTG